MMFMGQYSKLAGRLLLCLYLMLMSASANATQYIGLRLFTTPFTQQSFNIMKSKLPQVPGSQVKVGFGIILNCLDSYSYARMGQLNTMLQLCQQNDVPIVICLDVEQWLDGHPELWNWWDPASAGYSSANCNNVEWYGWSSSNAVKISWRNWGSQMRVLPAPNLMSPAFRSLGHTVYDTYIPVILTWYNNLPADKKYLFMGFIVGVESSVGVNAFYYPNGNYYKETYPNTEAYDPTYGLS